MSDEKNNCCCEDPRSPSDATPERSGGGSALAQAIGSLVMALGGSRGVDPATGEPRIQPVSVTPDGALKVQVEGKPYISPGELVMENITIVFSANAIVISDSGSGSFTWTPAS